MSITELKVFFRTSLFRYVALLTFLPVAGFAQDVRVEALADTNSIRIGEQFQLFLEATHGVDDKVTFPALPDTFSLMEVVRKSDIDTVNKANGKITRRQTYLITSFDSGFHVIPPFIFKTEAAGNTVPDTISTRPLLITVTGITVDTTRAIKDLKGQIGVPYTWRDFLPWILGAILVFMIIYLLRRYFKKGKPAAIAEKPAPLRPAHETALEALNELEAKKLWQNGNHKAYHSSISDIIRTFIEHRWKIHAMEMTTDEILRVQLISGLEKSTYDELKYLLELADQVKFAKLTPVVFENEQSIRNAYAFVNACRETTIEKEVKPS